MEVMAKQVGPTCKEPVTVSSLRDRFSDEACMCGILQGPGVENSDTEAEYMIAAHPILTILKTHPCTRGSDPYMTVSGGAGLSGALDDGVGKWRLAVEPSPCRDEPAVEPDGSLEESVYRA